MEAEDELIVVIVGESKQKPKRTSSRFPVPFVIKDEPLDENELADIIETAKKYGHRLDVFDENTEAVNIKKELILGDNNVSYEIVKNVKVEHKRNNNDEDYIPNQEEADEDEKNDSKNKKIKYKKTKHKKAIRKLPSAKRKSFVQQLRQEYPELQKDNIALISTLLKIMKNVKRPTPPKDYFIMNENLFQCTKCGATSETEQAAGRHYQEKHGKRYLVCYACGMDFTSTTILYKHEKRCTEPDAEIVLKARAQFLGRKGRSRPFLLSPSEYDKKSGKSSRPPSSYRRFGCSQCSGQFSSKVLLESHENMHLGLRPYRCNECPCAYTSVNKLRRHLLKHTDVQYICDYCQRSFKVKETLVVHLRTHMPERKFPCEYCQRRYATKHALTAHVRHFHLQLPHACACPICPMSYPRMSLVRDHMKKAHEMTLMTRKMFFKALPTMSESQLSQEIKIMTPNGTMFFENAVLGQ